MPSLRSTLLAAAAVLIGAASADYVIDPDSVPLSTRQSWCQNEIDTCPFICSQTSTGDPLVNTCDADSLTYGCLCSNNMQPNVSEYTLTLPYFVCTEWGNQCVTKCGQDHECASNCRQQHPCGATDPKRKKKGKAKSTATLAPSASATDDGTTIYTGAPGEDGSVDNVDSTSKSSQKNPAAVLDLGRAYGLAIVFGGLFAGFAML